MLFNEEAMLTMPSWSCQAVLCHHDRARLTMPSWSCQAVLCHHDHARLTIPSWLCQAVLCHVSTTLCHLCTRTRNWLVGAPPSPPGGRQCGEPHAWLRLSGGRTGGLGSSRGMQWFRFQGLKGDFGGSGFRVYWGSAGNVGSGFRVYWGSAVVQGLQGE